MSAPRLLRLHRVTMETRKTTLQFFVIDERDSAVVADEFAPHFKRPHKITAALASRRDHRLVAEELAREPQS